MSTSYVRYTFRDDTDTLFDPTSIVLSDPTGAYGVKRNDTDAVVVADGAAFTNIGVGIYEKSWTDPAADLTYTAYAEYVIGGETYWTPKTVIGTPSSSNPVTTDEAKDHCRVTTAADDTLIGGLITAATTWAERYTRRQFITSTETQYFDDFADPMILEWSPLSSAVVQYYDTAAVLQTLAAANYTVDTTASPGRIRLAYGYSWPAVYAILDAVLVTYVAGYGIAATVPEPIKLAIKMLVAHWYEHRESHTDGFAVTEVPMAVKALLSTYRVLEAHS